MKDTDTNPGNQVVFKLFATMGKMGTAHNIDAMNKSLREV